MISTLQIIFSVILIVLVLVQERSAGLGGIFGGGGSGTSYQTRRGFERLVYWATIVAAGIFAVLALLNFVL